MKTTTNPGNGLAVAKLLYGSHRIESNHKVSHSLPKSNKRINYAAYELAKRRLQSLNLPPKEYEQRVRVLTNRLGV